MGRACPADSMSDRNGATPPRRSTAPARSPSPTAGVLSGVSEAPLFHCGRGGADGVCGWLAVSKASFPSSFGGKPSPASAPNRAWLAGGTPLLGARCRSAVGSGCATLPPFSAGGPASGELSEVNRNTRLRGQIARGSASGRGPVGQSGTFPPPDTLRRPPPFAGGLDGSGRDP